MRKLSMKFLLALGAVALFGTIALAQAEVIQKGGVRIALDGNVVPNKLPRSGAAPVKVEVKTSISATGKTKLPQLTRIAIAINRFGKLDQTGLPVCEISDIQPSTTEKALEACGPSKVGEGQFAATVGITKSVAFPSSGKLVAFSGRYKGKPAILAHVYGTDPIPTSFTLPFIITKGGGTFGTTLTATLPASEGNFVTGLDLSLGRTFTSGGKRRSFASASCPAPKGVSGGSFPFAKVSYSFAAGVKPMHETLVRACKARG